ncbi:MAG: lectin-like protein [Verrucomicrobia bacterium]|nr:lectin-like protein [Verrucomicrobiota bacterium]
MKTLPRFLSLLATLVSATSLFGAETLPQPGRPLSTPVDLSKTPEGLSASDWSGIRGAYERNRHAIVANPDGTHQARNPGQAWLTRFDARGFTVTPDDDGWSWGLELSGYGEPTEVRLDGEKVSFIREDGLTEWFVNDTRGLEQGWTLAKRPERADATEPLRLHLAVRGSLRPQVSDNGASVAFLHETGGAALTYGGLRAWDADGNTVQARFARGEDGSAGLSVVVDDADARYPITVDPIAQQAYLKASNTEASQYGDLFGSSVAVSGDTVVVGAEGESSSATGVNGDQSDNSATYSGAAYVFVRDGAGWSQQAYLKASSPDADDCFGFSVAVSGDTVVVGVNCEDSNATGVNGNPDDNSGYDSGAAYVFVPNGTTWSEQAYLKASNTGSSDLFGWSVAVSGDTVVVGAKYEDSNATGVNGNQADNSASGSGAAYVFVRNGTTWSQQAYLKASNTGVDDWFGYSVAVSGDTVVIGAISEDSNSTGANGNQTNNSASFSGAAYVFVRNGSTWSQQHYLKASNAEAGDSFGAVAVSGDTVVIGSGSEDSNATGVNGNQADNSASNSGAAYVFLRRYSLSISADHGSVQGAGDYETGAIATLTVTASPGYAFIGWSGDATGTINPLSVLMNTDKTITANFAPSTFDTDGDGLLDYLEVFTYGTDPNLQDTDGDGLTDGWEVGLARFTVIAGNFTWAQARGDAHARDGELACFPTESLWNRALQSIGENALMDVNGLWLGATDETTEGIWKWVTAQPVTFTNWATGEPNNLNDSDYAAVAGDLGGEIGKWYDYRGVTTRDGYILETGYSTDPTKADTDGDGINDGAEITAGLNPLVADTDGDGLSDGQEVNLTHTNPKLADSNGNGTSDALEDPDGDCLTNLAEITQHGTNPLLADSDSDGLNDGAEISHAGSSYQLVPGSFTYPQAVADAALKHGRVASFPDVQDYSRMAAKARQTTQGYLWIGLSDAATEGTWLWSNGSAATYSRWLAGEPSGGTSENQVVIMENSTQWADAAGNFLAAGYLFERVGLDPLNVDTDADGLTDGQEINTTHSSPVLDDTDGDGLPDGAEVNIYHSSPLLVDTDADGLNDREEVEVYHSNPSLKDTDGDGFDDLFEVNTGFDPALASSTPDAASSIRTAVEFRFNAANGVSYRIEASTDLNQWEIIEPAIIGQSAVVTRFYSTENTPKRYFRVRRN